MFYLTLWLCRPLFCSNFQIIKSSQSWLIHLNRTLAITHWDKIRSSKVPDDTSGSADSHVADERKEPSEKNKHAGLTLQHKSSISVICPWKIDTYPNSSGYNHLCVQLMMFYFILFCFTFFYYVFWVSSETNNCQYQCKMIIDDRIRSYNCISCGYICSAPTTKLCCANTHIYNIHILLRNHCSKIHHLK